MRGNQSGNLKRMFLKVLEENFSYKEKFTDTTLLEWGQKILPRQPLTRNRSEGVNDIFPPFLWPLRVFLPQLKHHPPPQSPPRMVLNMFHLNDIVLYFPGITAFLTDLPEKASCEMLFPFLSPFAEITDYSSFFLLLSAIQYFPCLSFHITS